MTRRDLMTAGADVLTSCMPSRDSATPPDGNARRRPWRIGSSFGVSDTNPGGSMPAFRILGG
jgi:hypothetical protein